jgi:hypothetical protein
LGSPDGKGVQTSVKNLLCALLAAGHANRRAHRHLLGLVPVFL